MRNPSSNLWVLICLACLMGGAGSGFLAGWIARNKVGVIDLSERPEPISRADFESMVYGKTPAEVIESVGPPVKTIISTRSYWYYNYRTYDSITGRVDEVTMVVWKADRNGNVVVDTVTFS